MRKGKIEKIGIGAFALFFAVSMAVPAVSFANTDTESEAPATNGSSATLEAAPTETEVEGTASDVATTPASDCVVTLRYWENVTYEDPDSPANEEGRHFIGEKQLTGFQEGQQLSAWNYVVNIPGFFFFDGWPGTMTVSTDPSKNVFDFFYFRLSNRELTVNYYLMTGADLNADNWADALAPDTVQFNKLGTQTFTNRPAYELIEGDAYEYELDGTYVIDTYPAQIRLQENPDLNVINVLYTPQSDLKPPAEIVPPEDVVVPPAEGDVVPPTDVVPPVELPGDTEIGKDEITGVLPDDIIVEDEILSGGVIPEGGIEITDEMLANPIPREQAQLMSNIYQEGVDTGMTLAQTGDDTTLVIPIVVAVSAALLLGVAAFMSRVYRKKRLEK